MNKQGCTDVQYPPVQQPVGCNDDELYLRELLSVIWAGRSIILAITFLFTMGSALYAINQPNLYKAQVLLAPSSSSSNSSFSTMARQFGGIAGLAGINLGGGNSGDKVALAIQVMRSRQFVTRFIEKYDLLVPLMAIEGWDLKKNELQINPDIYDAEKSEWVRETESLNKPKPTPWEAYKKFNELFSVGQAKDSGMVTVSIEHFSPYVAKSWADWLVKDLNAEMKKKDVSEAQSSIQFLKHQLESTQISEMQNVFYQLIEEQTKTIMLSEVRLEYVFVTIDPAVVPEEKSNPKRTLIVVSGFLLGGLLSFVLVLIRNFVKKMD